MGAARRHGGSRRWRGLACVCAVWASLLVACAPVTPPSPPGSATVERSASPPASPVEIPLRDLLQLRPAASDAHSLIVQPDDGRDIVLGAINRARESVLLEIYLLSDRDTIHALQAAVNRGVVVRVLLEERPCCAQSNGMTRAVFAELQEARVQVQWSSPSFRLTHAKLLVVDDTQVFVMTQNLTRSGFQYNREAILLSHDAGDVASARAVFMADWKRVPLVPDNPNLVVSNVNARAKLLALIGGARRSLDVAGEIVQDTQIEDALIAAQRRGVAVRFLGSVPPTGSADDASAPGRKHLAGGGVAVRVLATPYLHTKTIVADDTVAYVGSVNFSTASLDQNREVGILTENRTVIARLDAIYAKDWAAARSG